jgi:hypothetical protein
MTKMHQTVLAASLSLAMAAPAAAQEPEWAKQLAEHMEVHALAMVAHAAEALDGVLQRGFREDRRGPEVAENFSRTVRLGRDGTFDLSNIAGDIVVTGGGGDEVRIDAVKRARGRDDADGRARLQEVTIEVRELPNRVDVRTEYPRNGGRRNNPFVAVDYTITLPQATRVTVKTVSGDVRVTNVRGELTAETVSGDVTTAGARRNISLRSVSGDVRMTDTDVDRAEARTVSGNVEYVGRLARNGNYEMDTHSGNILLNVETSGFDLEASTFSGDVRSDYALMLGGTQVRSLNGRGRGRPGRGIRGTSGDASARLSLRSFSGDIVINRK